MRTGTILRSIKSKTQQILAFTIDFFYLIGKPLKQLLVWVLKQVLRFLTWIHRQKHSPVQLPSLPAAPNFKLKFKILALVKLTIFWLRAYQPKFSTSPPLKLNWSFPHLSKLKFDSRLSKLSIPPLPKVNKFSIKLFQVKLFLAVVIIGGGMTFAGIAFVQLVEDLPDVRSLYHHQPAQTTKIYDRNGVLLYQIYGDENRSLVPFDEIPIHLIQATLAIEDQDFYQHAGFSLRGITRAFRSNLENETLQGGSTITQQLIKNTLLTPERTWERKIKEVVLSFMAEFYFDKNQILTMYLNQVSYGGSTYGIEAAAQKYFGKSVRQINLAEAAYLAGLPAAPTRYSPYGQNPELAKNRQRQVLRRMVEDGYISPESARIAMQEELAIQANTIPIQAPHFVMYVRDLLSRMYGEELVERGGLEVHTSLDLDIQKQVEALVQNEVSKLKNLNVSNGAALVTEPETGEVLAMVGSVDYFNLQADGQVNITVRDRQPGSSIKPITYAHALANGLNPATIIPDTPVCYQIKGQDKPYCPKNYDNRYHGHVTLRQALANSYNIPAVKTLAQFDLNDYIDTAEKLGITTWKQRNRFGLALTLGGGEVKMTDMAVAYGVFANQGKRVGLRPILSVSDTNGRVNANQPCIYSGENQYLCQQEQVLNPGVAYQISHILSDNQARSDAFGSNSVLHIPDQQVAVKTGTTNNLRDNWTIGYTEDFLVTVWVGNNDNQPMSYIASGITGASPIWQQITLSLMEEGKTYAFSQPDNLDKVAICSLTGTLACNGCPTVEEFFIRGTQPINRCNQDQVARILAPEPPQP